MYVAIKHNQRAEQVNTFTISKCNDIAMSYSDMGVIQRLNSM